MKGVCTKVCDIPTPNNGPWDTSYSSDGNKGYLHVTTEMEYFLAALYCKGLGGRLATFKNKKQWEFLTDQVTGETVWIGLTNDDEVECANTAECENEVYFRRDDLCQQLQSAREHQVRRGRICGNLW